MAEARMALDQFTGRLREVVQHGGLGAPLALLAVLAMVILPLPPVLLDLFFTFNIAISLVVLLAVIYVKRPLDFSVFPTVLLLATLLRLALNIASTRVVLLEGHTGADAAGKVIEAFGAFVVGGNYAVGLVVFAILVIINFVVVTKGAGRVSEVSARFTLDSMPGKQMAIDADLNAGLITQEEAQARREDVVREADFYGAMDGASKFVRGDAIAGVLILFINIVGGLIIGVAQHGLPLAEAVQNYTLLTIGDGLVAQIPSLLLSTATAIIVTRVSSEQNMGQQFLHQVFEDPRSLGVTGGVLTVIGLIPGMPNVAFLSLAAVAFAGAWWVARQRRQGGVEEEAPPAPATPPAAQEPSWDDVVPVDLIGLEVGYRLIPLVDVNQGGELMARIKGVRKKLSQELGFLIPSVHIRDNLDLAPTAYRITLHGVVVGEHEVLPDKELAINPGHVFGPLKGIPTRDPAFGLEAVWIDPAQRQQAQSLGYTVVDPSTVLATHLSQILQRHAHELLGREEVQQLLDNLAQRYPKLVEDLVPDTVPLGTLVKVLQGLLEEGVPITDLRTILEAVADAAAQGRKDPQSLVAAARTALGRAIVQRINGTAAELEVITLDPSLEQLLQQSVGQGAETGTGLEPGLAERIHQALLDAAQRQEMAGKPAVLLVNPTLRPVLARFVRKTIPGLSVLAYTEVPEDKQIKVISVIGQGGQP